MPSGASFGTPGLTERLCHLRHKVRVASRPAERERVALMPQITVNHSLKARDREAQQLRPAGLGAAGVLLGMHGCNAELGSCWASSRHVADPRSVMYDVLPLTCTSVADTRNPQGPRGRTGVSIQYAAVRVVAPLATSPSNVGSPRVVHEYL